MSVYLIVAFIAVVVLCFALMFARVEIIGFLGGIWWLGIIPALGEREIAESLGFPHWRGWTIAILLVVSTLLPLIGEWWAVVASVVLGLVCLIISFPVADELSYICGRGKLFAICMLLFPMIVFPLMVFTDKFEPKEERL